MLLELIQVLSSLKQDDQRRQPASDRDGSAQTGNNRECRGDRDL